jgi:Tol biopolymer transport system component
MLEQTKIAFSSYRDGNFEIYTMNPDGTEQTRLTNNPGKDEYPSWSPDGKKVAFGSNRDGNAEVYIMNADGSNQTRLTDNPAFDHLPSWSPDGKKIAFYSLRNDVPPEKDERPWYEYNAEIYVMNADGSKQKNITNNPAYDGYPSWSPFLKTGKGQLGMELKPKEVK